MRKFCYWLLMVTTVGAMPFACPNISDLKPCHCKRMAYGLHVTCDKVNSSTALEKSFKILRDYQVHYIILHEVCLEDTVPADLFEGLKVKELKVEKSRLKFSQPAFTGLDESLNVLNVAQRSMIKSREDFALAHLSKLTELNMKTNNLGKVADTWLNDKVPHLHKLILDENNISEVEDNAFTNLREVVLISLANNHISTIKRSMFPRPAKALKRLDLSNNEISTLPFNIFSEMPALEEIILTGNKLETLEEDTWFHIWSQLRVVLVLENNLKCDEKMLWLKKFRKPHNLRGICAGPDSAIGRPLVDFILS